MKSAVRMRPIAWLGQASFWRSYRNGNGWCDVFAFWSVFWPGVGILRKDHQPLAVALLGQHHQEAKALRTRGTIIVFVSMNFPTPVHDCEVGSQKTHRGIHKVKEDSWKRPLNKRL